MLITVRDLAFQYGKKPVLAGINAVLPRGEVVALVGANGSGKTTLMHILLGDLRATRGEVFYDAALRTPNSIAFVPDKPPLYPDWTVLELLLRLAAERGMEKDAVDAVVMRCGLSPVLGVRCRELSHGYRQRASLAQALLHRPQWLCMDEPMNGLDEEQRAALRTMVVQLAREGMTVLLTLHDLADVVAVADRVWYLRNGRLFDLPRDEECDMWAVFVHEGAAARYASGVQQGRARGFSRLEYSALADALREDPDLLQIGRAYPVAALQARMAACH
ncbi:MAG: ATP-binding cassette domain-containing protein [Cardiobacteriaceae bacterium]|nr:ATP-binding cassette domain-containing protein [Cardiobacteriaceae bacterium]